MNKKLTDIFFKHLFAIVALFSVLALGAILLFVFAQGSMPFFTSTNNGIQLVAERIDELIVNDVAYIAHHSYINIPKDTEYISIRIPVYEDLEDLYDYWEDWDDNWYEDWDEEIIEKDIEKILIGETILDIYINYKTVTTEDTEKMLSVKCSDDIEITNPENYVYTIKWPAVIAALEKKIHIIFPEPPYSFGAFLSGLEWRPTRDKIYGILPMIAGTIMAGFGAVILGVPIALLCAIFMSEFLEIKIAAFIRAGVELLAGIPSVVYGFFGLMVIVPWVRNTFNIPSGNTLLSAVIVLALMILPTIITIAETSLRAVPKEAREASLALGASKMQTSWKVVLPHAKSGVIAGIILGISRAVGETMAVILVAGNSPHFTINPLNSTRTLTSTIAMEMGYASGRHSEMLFSIGVVLFSIILILNSLILWYRRRMEEEF